jgi:hypothetical protein
MEEGKIATAWPQFGATERSPSMYIRMRVPGGNTLLKVQVGINFSPFGEPASRFTSATETREMEEGKIANGLGTMVRLKEVHQCKHLE